MAELFFLSVKSFRASLACDHGESTAVKFGSVHGEVKLRI